MRIYPCMMQIPRERVILIWRALSRDGGLLLTMEISSIRLTDYRNYADQTLDFAPGINVLAGGNAQGASAKVVPDQPILSRKQYLQGACIGLIAGLASGYVGVGGGFIMVPLMLAILDIPMSLASGTSLIAIMILAIPGVIEQGLLGNIDYLAGIAIVVGSIPGALVGARLVRVVPERQLRFIFGGFLLVAAVMLMLNEFGILG